MEEIEIRQKKERKALESDKRQAMKKIKGTAGKSQKAKDLIAAAEEEWTAKENEMIQRHEQEMASWKDLHNSDPVLSPVEQSPNPSSEEPSQSNSAASKKIQKRLQQRQQQLEKEAEILRSIENSGPSSREIENNRMMELYLSPIQLTIHEIQADGNCLYRAVAHQLEYLTKEKVTYLQMRQVCADSILNQRQVYEPFLELSGEDGEGSFDAYVEKVRHSSEWGGHVELRALAAALEKTIIVYSADSSPLHIGSEEYQVTSDAHHDGTCIRLSFHKSFYALGEHYNSVVSL
jgi:OTU domain-containing protein 6